jgi:outer membrane protein assembly factor BamB
VLVAATVGAACLLAAAPALAATAGGGAWTQFQGNASHAGAVDTAAAPPYKTAWTLAIPPGGPDHQFGVSAPVLDVAMNTAVAVGPTSVIGVDLGTGRQTFSVKRLFGPSVTPALAQVKGVTAVVYPQGWGDAPPTSAGASATSSAGSSATGSVNPSSVTSGSPPSEVGAVSQLAAFDLATQRPLWKAISLGTKASVAGVTTVGTHAFVGTSDGTVYDIDLIDGSVLWRRAVGGNLSTSLAASADAVVLTLQGTRTVAPAVVALKPSDGSQLWRHDPEAVGVLSTPPTIAGNDVYVGFSNGDIRDLSLSDGGQRWGSRVNGPILTPSALAVDGDALYAVDVVGQLYRFDSATGARVWDFALNDSVFRAPPVVAQDQVLVGTNSGRLAVVDTTSGHLVWDSGSGSGLLRGFAPSGDVIVAVRGGSGAGLVAYQHDDGGTLVDTVSPTVFNPGTNARNFVLIAIPLVLIAIFGGRLLSRRMGPAFIYEDDEHALAHPFDEDPS